MRMRSPITGNPFSQGNPFSSWAKSSPYHARGAPRPYGSYRRLLEDEDDDEDEGPVRRTARRAARRHVRRAVRSRLLEDEDDDEDEGRRLLEDEDEQEADENLDSEAAGRFHRRRRGKQFGHGIVKVAKIAKKVYDHPVT